MRIENNHRIDLTTASGLDHSQQSKSRDIDRSAIRGTENSGDQAELLRQLRQLSAEDRTAKLAEVGARLASGEYLTEQVAEKTADALLGFFGES